MTVEAILNEVLSECGIDDPAPVISANTFEMRQIKALMNAAGRDINSRFEWSKAFASFDVAGGEISASLPSDFQEMPESGAVLINDGSYNPIRSIVSPPMWQMMTATPSEEYFCHMLGGMIYFSKALPTSGATVRYIKNAWVSGGANEITLNTDTVIFPESLLARSTIYRWKRQKGLPYDDVMAEFEADLEVAIKADRGVA